MTYNQRFISTISIFLTFSLCILQKCPSLACEKNEEPEIKRVSVSGAADFACQVDPYLKMNGRKLLICDLHGVLTRYSEPPHHQCPPRGDMVDYLKYLASCHNLELEIIVASAWDVFLETVKQVKFLGLTEMLKMHGDIIEGNLSIQDTVYEYVRLGNLISVRKQKIKEGSSSISEVTVTKREFYVYKSLSPMVADGMECKFDYVIFLDDSQWNVGFFAKTVPLTSYYPKLKMVLLFDIPTIKGEVNLLDQIPTALLPDAHRARPINDSRKSDVLDDVSTFEDAIASRSVPQLILPSHALKSPLAMAGFYPIGDTDSDDDHEPTALQIVSSSVAPSSLSSSFPPLISSTVVSLSTASDHSPSTHVHLSRSAEICRLEEGMTLNHQHKSRRGQLTKSH